MNRFFVLATALVAVMFSSTAVATAVPSNLLGEVQRSALTKVWEVGPGSLPPEGAECQPGEIPVVRGTADEIPGGDTAQVQLDSRRLMAVAPAGWDGSWGWIAGTTTSGDSAGVVGCAPRGAFPAATAAPSAAAPQSPYPAMPGLELPNGVSLNAELDPEQVATLTSQLLCLQAGRGNDCLGAYAGGSNLGKLLENGAPFSLRMPGLDLVVRPVAGKRRAAPVEEGNGEATRRTRWFCGDHPVVCLAATTIVVVGGVALTSVVMGNPVVDIGGGSAGGSASAGATAGFTVMRFR
ncbi:MAG: hypothetical protein HYV32_00360 [Candidatus Kerfeldbacteria bacterium]|nr:hypothetical protein [Candidatus Kerfeldbacteria bacterium]